MTIFGKVIIGAMLITAAILIFKNSGKSDEKMVPEPVADITNSSTSDLGQNESTSSTSSSSSSTIEFTGSLEELATRGGSYKCVFDHKTDIGESTGTVFISDKHIRGDFNSVVKVMSQTTNIESHMISDGDFTYTWSPSMPNGLKLPVNKTASSSANSSQGFDYSQKLDYKCDSWTIDPNKFVLPKDIEFKATL